MFGMFKKKVRKAAVEVKKMENRDAVEATVWGAYAIAYADFLFKHTKHVISFVFLCC